MVKIPTNRAPTHPGEMLREEFLKPMGISQKQLSVALRVPFQRINELVNRKRGVTPSTALRLSIFFGNSPDFWMSLQQRWDLYWAKERESDDLLQIESLT